MSIQLNNIDLVSPLISLLAYKIGTINEFDNEIIKYGRGLGLDTQVLIIILLAQKRQEIELIIQKYALPSSALMNFLRLKKLSAEKNFRLNYGIVSDTQIAVLLEKQNIW